MARLNDIGLDGIYPVGRARHCHQMAAKGLPLR